MTLRDDQLVAHQDALDVLKSGGHRLYTAPTGSGKSYIQAANHVCLQPSGLVTVVPSTEIGLGIFNKLPDVDGYKFVRDWSVERQQAAMESCGIWTVMRLYNELMSGCLSPPKFLQWDEGHHTTANTYEAIHALCNNCPAVAYTATGFRGTPEETKKLRDKWGEPKPVLTLKQAIAASVVARPDFSVWPLLDDQTIKVVNGEFETKAVESALKGVSEELVYRITSKFYHGGRWIRPIMLTAPGVASAQALTALLNAHGPIACCVTGETVNRQELFRQVVDREKILVQVNVVSEGVDLPIRIHVDTAPCMSPVRWMQRVGRGTRPTAPGEAPPQYICTNHNFIRHAYLFAGVVPSAQVRDAQRAWGPDFKPTRRMFARALGLEGFGKFTVSQVPLVDGSFCGLYALQTPNGTHQYAILLHPTRESPMFFARENPHTGEMAEKRLDNGTTVQYKVKDYGPWKVVKTIPNADGYVSTKPLPVSPRMLDWWRKPKPGRGAEWCGLDPGFVPNAREFQILPIMCNTGVRFKETA